MPEEQPDIPPTPEPSRLPDDWKPHEVFRTPYLLESDLSESYLASGAILAEKQLSDVNIEEEFPHAVRYLKIIEDERSRCLGATKELLQAAEILGLQSMLLFTWSVGFRTAELARSYLNAVRMLNMTTAATLPRIQLDSFLRFLAVDREGIENRSILEGFSEGKDLGGIKNPFWKPAKRQKGPRAKKNARNSKRETC